MYEKKSNKKIFFSEIDSFDEWVEKIDKGEIEVGIEDSEFGLSDEVWNGERQSRNKPPTKKIKYRFTKE